ncbi:hypothetical protein VST7929_01395 [Vibrio stylophorae]|uniref:Lon N-terminal domain-containing protein n=1 Tax=Vibrio stylophorae TaxID=659351 RepID=A0ABM8ZTN1_9VIBR|nr:LON peptidase substrate-binding domain-containing protein [Vibrio stylophorae]CAH0533525.1 hypothetical protein VST7929_01395 [Vibrio stylophorae]
MQLAAFPLASHLFPGGIMQLRIFEPRYVRMVKECCAQQCGFALAMIEEQHTEAEKQMLALGTLATHVKIIDFDQLEDGFFSITIQGVERVKIHDIRGDDDGLLVAQTIPLTNWAPSETPSHAQSMVLKLKAFFRSNPEYAALYPHFDYQNAVWLCYRWLEILPLSCQQKQSLLSRDSHQDTLRFLQALFQQIDEQDAEHDE